MVLEHDYWRVLKVEFLYSAKNPTLRTSQFLPKFLSKKTNIKIENKRERARNERNVSMGRDFSFVFEE